MLPRKYVLSLVISLCLLSVLFGPMEVLAESREVLDVPYIHQRYDTSPKFVGAFSCAPTSAVMVLAYHDRLQPDPLTLSEPSTHQSPYGKYVSREYEYRGKQFNDQKIIHDVCGKTAIGKGAWGYIWQDATDEKAYGIKTNLMNYLKEHDMDVEFIWSPSSSRAKKIVKNEIDSGRPPIARNYLTESGHYVVIVGYEIDSNGNFWYLVNDPNGRRSHYKKEGEACWGCYTERDEKRDNPRCPQPVKYSYEELKLENPSRGLIKIQPEEIQRDIKNSPFPDAIKVYLTDEDRTVEVDFKEYCKNVLPNEWYGSWDMDALKAGALAVKTYGWYRKKVDKYSDYEFDVRNDAADQDYEPNSNYWKTDRAIEETWNYVMTRDGEIFESQYINGTNNSAEVREKYEGRLSQFGSDYLASEKDMGWKEILHYYYDSIEIKDLSELEKKSRDIERNIEKTSQKTCNKCGDGIFNFFCDKKECHSLGRCHFQQKSSLMDRILPFGNVEPKTPCASCDFGDNTVEKCSNYTTKRSCDVDPCKVNNCKWAGKDLSKDPRCIDKNEYERLEELGRIKLALHPSCKREGDGEVPYNRGKKLKEDLDFYFGEIKMRNGPKCKWKDDSNIPKSFPYWTSDVGSNNIEEFKLKHITISLDHDNSKNMIYYSPDSAFGKKLALGIVESLKNDGYSIQAKSEGFPENPKIYENSYYSTAISIEIDLSKLKIKDLSDAIKNSVVI